MNTQEHTHPLIPLSIRPVSLACAISSLFWLMTSSLLAWIAAIKLHAPHFLTDSAGLTYGRVIAAAETAGKFGWIPLAALSLLSALHGKRHQIPFPRPWIPATGLSLWNIAIAIGVAEVLIQGKQGFEGIHFGGAATGLLLIGYLLLSGSLLELLIHRNHQSLTVSESYSVAALFTFPWLLLVATGIHQAPHPIGVVHAAAESWFQSSFYWLYLLPTGFAIAFAILEESGAVIPHLPMARWSLGWQLALGAWTGMHHFAGGPIPAWMVSVSVVATVWMLLPLLGVAHNFARMLRLPSLHFTISNRLIATGGALLLIGGLSESLFGFRTFQILIQHTWVPQSLGLLHLSGITLILFGALLHLLPLLLDNHWISENLVHTHFWLSLTGCAGAVLSLLVAGVTQLEVIRDPASAWMQSVSTIRPLLWIQSLSGVFFISGQFVFLLLVSVLFLKIITPERS